MPYQGVVSNPMKWRKMAAINYSSLNVLTREQAEEACRIIELIGHVSNLADQ
jgi:hypothetical protein